MLEIKNLTKKYTNGDRDVLAIQDFNLQIGNADFVSIVGPSGCGKSTLLRIISGLIQKSNGSVLIENKETGKPDEDNGASYLRNCFLTFWADYCENLNNSTFCLNFKDSSDCLTDILEQAEGEYRKVTNQFVTYKTFYGDESSKDWSADNTDMLFASFQALNNWHEKWYYAFDCDHFDFMVVDESHHSQAPTYKEVIDYFTCKKIGMTATPDRMDLKDIREIFGEEVYTVTLEEGIVKGVV